MAGQAGPAGPPALSVLVLNYNYARFLPQCLDSILAQTFSDFEVVVLDDASTDESESVLKEYERRPRVRVVRHGTNRGFAESLAEGTEFHSRGEFLTVISADDWVLDADAFAVQMAALAGPCAVVACTTAFLKVGPGQSQEMRRLAPADTVFPARELLTGLLCKDQFSLLHSGTIIRADAYRRTGGYRRDLRHYVDLAMWISLGAIGPVAYIDRALYGYRIHPAQYSGSTARRRAMLREGLMVLGEGIVVARQAGVVLNRRRVWRSRIADLALADAFADRPLTALERCWDALSLAPASAATSRGWWLALARASLGRHGWNALRTVIRPLRRRAAR